MISEEITTAVTWITYAITCQAINIFGIVSNIINIICFTKQGFKEPINVSLVGLAVSDLGCLITLVWSNICLTPAFRALELPFIPLEFQFLTSGCPHSAFTRVSSWITALITLERCLCITAPLKVKQIVTSRRVCVATVSVSTTILAFSGLVYVVNRLDGKFVVELNRTLIGVIYNDGHEDVEQASVAINNAFFPNSAFVIITICTVTLVVKLREKAKWRSKAANSAQETVSCRNQKVFKMVVMLSTLFIVCFTPLNVGFIVMALVPEFSITGKHINTIIVLGGLSSALESINSSANIFIYYYMSTKYREAFHHCFQGCMCLSNNVRK